MAAADTRTSPRRARGRATKTGADDAPVQSVIGATQTLPQFLTQVGTLTTAQRRKIVDQARTMIEQLYVHLPLKRAMHAIDPLQRLKLLRYRLSGLSERQFHDEMIDTFTRLRDLHTNYILPRPYQSKTAFLPFLLEEYWDGSTRQYLASKMLAGFTHATFKSGVVVTSWNGAPIERAVELNADRQAGSNPDARHARGLEALTIRPMAMSSPPDEYWVIVGYRDGSTEREIRLDWQVFEPEPAPSGAAIRGRGRAARSTLGLDLRTELARRAKKALFNPRAMDLERDAARSRRTRADGPADASTMPDVFSFREVATSRGTFGYIRIWTFMVEDHNAFLAEFNRIAGLLPQRGLILDVRGNGGGNILCAEMLLQFLTPNTVEPTLLSFINTPLTLDICSRNDFVKEWAPSIEQSVETGEAYSQGLPLLPTIEYNRLGQRYQGRVVLVTDPLCYSATDIFSAGFQDNQVGPILSAGGRTGAGGANVWDHELLRQVLPGTDSPFSALPNGASFRVAIRRVMRAGLHRGVPLEDLGVASDAEHKMTRNDLLQGNVDLIEHAARLLDGQPRVTLSVGVAAASAGKRALTITTDGLDRVDIAVDDRPRATADVRDGAPTVVEIDNPGSGHDIVARGFKAGTLRVAVHTAS
jgi:Peptidase family S41